MAITKLRTEEYGGIKFAVQVSDAGRFSTEIPEYGDFYAETYGGLIEKVREAIRKQNERPKKPAIDVTALNVEPSKWGFNAHGTLALDMTLRGYAERTGELLMTHDGWKIKLPAGQFEKLIARVLTDAEHAEYRKIQEDIAAADRRLRKFEDDHRFDWQNYFGVAS